MCDERREAVPRVRRVPVGLLETNCYVVFDPAREDCAVIDPGDDAETVLRAAEGRKPAAVLLTHGHFDHIGAVRALAEKGAEVLIHEADAPMLTDPRLNACGMIGRVITAPPADRVFRDGDTLSAAGLTFTVIHTPGHTPGSCCFRCGDLLFTGDTVMAGGFGRTDLPGGSEADMRASLRKILPLARELTICGGHGE